MYLPTIENVKHKMHGVDGNDKAIDFTDAEKAMIIKTVTVCKGDRK